GIFPDITEPLSLQEDLSLGFVKKTPPSGLPLYGGKAKFTADVVLNYNGLQGDGKLDYLTSTAESEQFVFFPDSTKGKTYSYNNLAQGPPKEVPRPDCHDEAQNHVLELARKSMATFSDMAELIRLGAYRRGSNKEVDDAIAINEDLEAFLAQKKTEHSSIDGSFAMLAEIIAKIQTGNDHG
ncbi:MAG: hypothetical protein AAF352_04285, partial [Pseudomonadota bacterium]